MTYLWFVMLLILISIEFVTKKIVAIWFVISAAFTFVLSFFIADFTILFSFFAIGGYIFYILTKEVIYRRMNDYDGVDEVIDIMIGKTAIVNEKIDPNRPGQVSIDGQIWRAVSDETLPISELVTIIAIDDNILTVTKWKSN
ncbi:MAG: NfeD family protein [Bacilli bacterium]|nr:NfeD family protein [Bacilli bacterium]